DPRGTDAALGAAEPDQRLLHVAQGVAAEGLDGLDRATVGLAGRDQTGVGDLAVDEHGAGTTLPLAAAFLGPGQPEVDPEDVEQSTPRRARALARLAVDPEANRRAHRRPPASVTARARTSGRSGR